MRSITKHVLTLQIKVKVKVIPYQKIVTFQRILKDVCVSHPVDASWQDMNSCRTHWVL